MAFQQRWKLTERISKAYYDYGRLCAAHPLACLSISLLTTLFLSYPAIVRIRLPVSGGMMEVYEEPAEKTASDDVPDWLYLTPVAFIQQIVVRGSVEPWNTNTSALAPILAVKGLLSRAFSVLKLLSSPETLSNNESILDSICFRAQSPSASLQHIFPPKDSCLVLSPALFWHNNFHAFIKDNATLHTIFSEHCSNTMCVRDILFGSPTRFTGIKRSYQTNQTIEFAVTIFLSRFDPIWRSALISKLKSEFEIVKRIPSSADSLIHVFYKPRKYFADYFPLFASYLLCGFYFYFTVKKVQMVHNKWGLALAAFVTVFCQLSSTAGIVSYFELISSLSATELYPYLAMVVGLENVMCITRSVVYTPPSLDVASRLAHGLYQEGYSISKYFLLEMCFLLFGWFTFVPEIQDFCAFAFVGLVVDFYMQLFFYAPCLAFDLRRLGTEEKRKFSLMLFNTDLKRLKNFPPLTCPAKILLPSLFIARRRNLLTRSRSDTQLDQEEEVSASMQRSQQNPPNSHKTLRRTASTTDRAGSSSYRHRGATESVSRRLRVLFYWTRKRIVQRLLMAFFCCWVLWLAFVVQKWRVFELFGLNTTQSTAAISNATGLNTEGQLTVDNYHQHSYRWWPAFFAEYNISLSARYITFLPPVVIKTTVNPNDPNIVSSFESHLPSDPDHSLDIGPKTAASQPELDHRRASTQQENPEINVRIDWMERQITTMLVFSVLMPFTIVVTFILYVCFRSANKTRAAPVKKSTVGGSHRSGDQHKGLSDLSPLLFARVDLPIECVAVRAPNLVAAALLGGRVLVWNCYTGALRFTLNRQNFYSSSEPVTANDPPLTAVHRRPDHSPQPTQVVSDQPSSAQITQRSRANTTVTQTPMYGYIGTRNFLPTGATASNNQQSSPQRRTQVWCMDTSQSLAILGCSPGTLEIFCLNTGQLVGYRKEAEADVGITHLQVWSSRIVVVRLSGALELHEYSCHPQSTDSRSDHPHTLPVQIKLCAQIRAHSTPVNQLECTPLYVATAGCDSKLKVFSLSSTHLQLVHTLQGVHEPDAQIIALRADENTNLLYTLSDHGSIACWDLVEGQLIRQLRGEVGGCVSVDLALTLQFILALDNDGTLSFWDKFDGQLLAQLGGDEADDPDESDFVMINTSGKRLLAIGDNLAAICLDDALQLWDLDARVLMNQVKLPARIESLHELDAHSILCCTSSSELFRVILPSTIPSATLNRTTQNPI